MVEPTIREQFPELASIDDSELREAVVQAWAIAMDEGGVTDLQLVPWLPPTQRQLGLEEEYLVDHVRDVTTCAIGLAEKLLDRRKVSISLDTVIAGALVHDVSKLVEFDGMDETHVSELLGHPYYGVHIVAKADLPVELAHIVLSHTHRTAVEPATIEATIVRRADEVAAAAIRSTTTEDLRTV